MSKIKAVIPAAGWGTRFLPLTKAQPKEMLPVVDRPTIQWVVEEAIDAGIRDIAIITGEHKLAVENHFSRMEILEEALRKSGKTLELDKIRKLHNMANIKFIRQEEQKGLGDAILCAKEFVSASPFLVLLGDTICCGSPNCSEQLMNVFDKTGSSVFAVENINLEDTKRYGVISGNKTKEGIWEVDYLVEKPEPDKAPSTLGILGRYLFTPRIFKYLEEIKVGASGEYQLTDAMDIMANEENLHAIIFNGKRYDIGTMSDWFRSHIELSLSSRFRNIVEESLKK